MFNRSAALIECLLHVGAVKLGKPGEFKLRSGATSDIYIDCRLVTMHADVTATVGKIFAEAIINAGFTYKELVIFGVADGGIPLVAAILSTKIARKYGWRGGWVRKEAKPYGEKGDIAGFDGSIVASPILVIEDVITTGGAVLNALKVVESRFERPEAVMCLVDRTEGVDVFPDGHWFIPIAKLNDVRYQAQRQIGVLKRYAVTINLVMLDGSKPEDAEVDGRFLGTHEYIKVAASSQAAESLALDEFHASVAIGKLEHVNVNVDSQRLD